MTARAAATRYARALFDVALAEDIVERAQRELQQFADLVGGSEALTNVFANPAIPAVRKHGVASALLERIGIPSGPVSKLILLLADRDRLTLLSEVTRAYRNRVMEHQKIVRGDLTSAVPLAPDTLKRIESGLAQATGRRVMLDTRVDPSLIGGAVTRIGSTVYDGSVTTQLQKMKQSLIEGNQ
jgi:F-type H+-transporting ATPase subunit delta